MDTEDEAREIFLEAMKPCDLGKLEGPCPRYVVPSSGGLGQLTGSFPLPEVGNIRDFDDFLKSPAAPRQQMTCELISQLWLNRANFGISS